MRRMIVLGFVALMAMAATAQSRTSQVATGNSPYVDPTMDLVPGMPKSVRMTCENKKCGGFDFCIAMQPGWICDFSGGVGNCKNVHC